MGGSELDDGFDVLLDVDETLVGVLIGALDELLETVDDALLSEELDDTELEEYTDVSREETEL